MQQSYVVVVDLAQMFAFFLAYVTFDLSSINF